jgi:hypothetical protein
MNTTNAPEPRLLIDKHLDVYDYVEARREWKKGDVISVCYPSAAEQMGFSDGLFTIRIEFMFLIMDPERNSLRLTDWKHDQRWLVPVDIVTAQPARWIHDWSTKVAERYLSQIKTAKAVGPYVDYDLPVDPLLAENTRQMIATKYDQLFKR